MKKIARRLGISEKWLSRLLNGDPHPTVELAQRIVEASEGRYTISDLIPENAVKTTKSDNENYDIFLATELIRRAYDLGVPERIEHVLHYGDYLLEQDQKKEPAKERPHLTVVK